MYSQIINEILLSKNFLASWLVIVLSTVAENFNCRCVI